MWSATRKKSKHLKKHLTKPSRTSRNLKKQLDSMHSRLAQKCQKQLNVNRKHLLYYCVNLLYYCVSVNYWLEPEFGYNISKQNTSKKHIANLFMLHSFCQWRSLLHVASIFLAWSFHNPFICILKENMQQNPVFGQLLLDLWEGTHVQNVLMHDTFMNTMMFFQYILIYSSILVPCPKYPQNPFSSKTNINHPSPPPPPPKKKK